MADVRLLSYLAKVFPDELCQGKTIDSADCLRGSRVSVQLAVKPDLDGVIALDVRGCEHEIFRVDAVPVTRAAPDDRDDWYLRGAAPGLYPDLLIPATAIDGRAGEWVSFWIDLAPEETCEVVFTVKTGSETIEKTLAVRVTRAGLAKRELKCTHWFHGDCIADYYRLEVFSEAWWDRVGAFMRTAVQHGINMLLTPVFTPPLDTEVGAERRTVQLVGVTARDGRYAFDFTNFDRWARLARESGLEYLEISHLFTQWGAKAAPKVMATTENGYERIFGWETKASDDAYTAFLEAFADAFIPHLEALGLADKVMFHASDEPGLSEFFAYKKASETIRRLFGRFPVADALSEPMFLRTGLVRTPVVSVAAAGKFYGRTDDLWLYYCCGPGNGFMPNRFIAMPSQRNAILGFILYRYGAKGFLHWGYNFYNTQLSRAQIDPFDVTDAGGCFPAGDAFVVYPGEDGPLCSLRLKVFRQALDDCEALRLLERDLGRDGVMKLLNEGLAHSLDERHYPRDEAWLLRKRQEIYSQI